MTKNAKHDLPIYDGEELIMFPSLATWVVMNYANDPISAQRATVLLSEENISISAGQQKGYSNLAKLVMNDINSCTMLGRLCGNVAIQVQQNIAHRGRADLGKAQFLVSEWASVTKTAKGKALPSSRIRKEFNRFKDACHLWAAFELLDDERQHTVWQDEETMQQLLLTAAAFEEFFIRHQAFQNFNPWRIPDQFLKQHAGTHLTVWLPDEKDWVADKLNEYSADKLRG